jgi:hypothetical protein
LQDVAALDDHLFLEVGGRRGAQIRDVAEPGQAVDLTAAIDRFAAQQRRVIVLRVGEHREVPRTDGQVADHRPGLAVRRPQRQGHVQSRHVAGEQQYPFRLALIQRIQRLDRCDPPPQERFIPPRVAPYPDIDDPRGDDLQPQHTAGDLLRGDLDRRDPAAMPQRFVGGIADGTDRRDRLLAGRRPQAGQSLRDLRLKR